MRLSIRYQIVALIGAILFAALSTYIYLATTLVSSDKLASIYDFNSLLAGTLSEEVRTGLQGLADKLVYFGAEQSNAPPNDPRARALFSADNEILSLEVWKRTPGGELTRIYGYTDAPRLASLNLTEHDLEEARKHTPLALEVVASQRVLLQNASLPPDLALLRLSASSEDGGLVVVADLRPDRLLRTFGRSELYTVYLVDARGRVLVHPDPNQVLTHADVSDVPVVKDALDAKRARGAREFSSARGDIVGSFARVGLGDLAVIVEAPRAEAFRASVELTKRSALFALVVMFVALLATIYFSRRLTAPLRQLESTMAVISRGEFGVEVPVTSRNEIGAAQAAFNKMSHELSSREAQLQDKNQQLIQSEKLSALGELAAGLAHEVKNPMVGIVGFSQLGMEARSLDEAHEYFTLIESDAQRANGILQNLLEFARPQRLEVELLQPNEVVQGALRLVTHQLQIGGVRIETQLGTDLPVVAGNGNQLRQVLLNLMMNAGQAMEGSTEKRLTVRTWQASEGRVVLEVRDTGPGMTEDVRRRLFEPFFTTKPKGRGTGLGLSVSQSIVAHHDGEMKVESAPGKGAAFFVYLRSHGTAAAVAVAQPTSAVASPSKQK